MWEIGTVGKHNRRTDGQMKGIPINTNFGLRMDIKTDRQTDRQRANLSLHQWWGHTKSYPQSS